MTSRDCAVEGGGGRWTAVKENARHRTAVVLHRLPPPSTALHRRLISPSRLHLYDDPIVVEARALLTEGRVLERSEEHTSELQSPCNLVCRLLLEKKKK